MVTGTIQSSLTDHISVATFIYLRALRTNKKLIDYKKRQIAAYNKWAVGQAQKLLDDFYEGKNDKVAALHAYWNHELGTVDQSLLNPNSAQFFQNVLQTLLGEISEMSDEHEVKVRKDIANPENGRATLEKF
jgi:hypothetical protein